MTTTAGPSSAPPKATGFLELERRLGDEERMLQESVRRFVTERVLSQIGEWFQRGELPCHLVTELGAMGLLGMHLNDYGCAGASATTYGSRA